MPTIPSYIPQSTKNKQSINQSKSNGSTKNTPRPFTDQRPKNCRSYLKKQNHGNRCISGPDKSLKHQANVSSKLSSNSLNQETFSLCAAISGVSLCIRILGDNSIDCVADTGSMTSIIIPSFDNTKFVTKTIFLF